MEKTPKYEFGKPDQNDFYDVDVFNNNMEKVETAMTEFDDTGTVAEIKSFTEMLTKLVTGNKLSVTLRNLKAGLQFVLHAGSIVNNCVTDNPNLPLSAAQGKALMDAITVLNTKMLFSGLKLIYKLQPGESKNIDLVNYKYIVIEGVESKVIPTGLLNVTNISTSLTRAASDSYFCYEFVFLSKNKIQYHAAYCMGFNERTISIYGIE